MLVWNISESDSLKKRVSLQIFIKRKLTKYWAALFIKSLKIHHIRFKIFKLNYHNFELLLRILYFKSLRVRFYRSSWFHVYYRYGEPEAKNVSATIKLHFLIECWMSFHKQTLYVRHFCSKNLGIIEFISKAEFLLDK